MLPIARLRKHISVSSHTRFKNLEGVFGDIDDEEDEIKLTE